MKNAIIFIVGLAVCAPFSWATGSTSLSYSQLSKTDNKEFVGTYKVSDLPFDKIVISEIAGKLHYVAGEYEGDFTQVKDKVDTYTSQDGGGIVTFIRNDAGKITKMKLEVQGSMYEAIKDELVVANARPSISDYSGTYKMTGLPFEEITLKVVDNQLQIDAGGQTGMLTAVPDKADTFDASGQAIIRFERDEMNKIKKIILESQGMVFDGLRAVK